MDQESSSSNVPEHVSAIMRRVRSKGTGPEIALRKGLWSRGLRYRIAPAGLTGKPDIVLPSKRLAIFVDGDFWHGNQWRNRRLSALEDQFQESATKEYWLRKIRRNMSRDCANTATLLSEGWSVIRFWESDIGADLHGCTELVLEAIKEGEQKQPPSILASRTVAEFFAGIGLMRIGLEEAGWSVTFANDIDPQKYQMYGLQFKDDRSHFVLGDVHDIDAGSVPDVALATASFPCNDLSLAGSRGGLAGKQSSAFWGFIRVLDEMKTRRPLLVLLENVTGFLTSHGGADFASALIALNRLGYSVDAFILDAASFVPQSRQRLFVIGVMAENRTLNERVRTLGFYESAVRPKALATFILTHPNIDWRIRELPNPPETVSALDTILEDIPHEASEWWSSERATYLLSQMSVTHRATADRMIGGENWSYGTVFRRVRHGKSMAELRTDGIAGCLRTPRGGSGRQILFKAGRGKFFSRLLTARECARLMGAGDYEISVPLNQALFGFGDAVCVPVIEWIARYYLNPVVNELLRGRILRPERSEYRLGLEPTGS